MSVLSQIDPSAATDQTKDLLDGLQQRLGRIPNMIRVMAHSPTVLGGYLDFTYAMQRTTLPASLRNQLALVVAEGELIARSEEHTSELQSRPHLVCRLLLAKKK